MGVIAAALNPPRFHRRHLRDHIEPFGHFRLLGERIDGDGVGVVILRHNIRQPRRRQDLPQEPIGRTHHINPKILRRDHTPTRVRERDQVPEFSRDVRGVKPPLRPVTRIEVIIGRILHRRPSFRVHHLQPLRADGRAGRCHRCQRLPVLKAEMQARPQGVAKNHLPRHVPVGSVAADMGEGVLHHEVQRLRRKDRNRPDPPPSPILPRPPSATAPC